jgi:hypothetical protein
MKTIDVITDQHRIGSLIKIVDENGNELKHIKEYNVETKEALFYCFDEKGRAIYLYEGEGLNKTNGILKTEKRLLPNSKIVFLDVKY